MGGAKDRRRSVRILSAFPLTLLDDADKELDGHAVAHDVSDKGFKIETRADLKKGQSLRFALSLDADGDIKGRARIVWCERSDLSYWAGGEFIKMSRSDRRRVRRVTSPSDVNWNALTDKAILALSLLLATQVVRILLSSVLWRGVIGGMIPTTLAAFAMGWALRVLLRRR